MAYSANRLPSRFPVGTKFVVESRPRDKDGNQVVTRHIEFPDGTFLPLPTRPTQAEKKAVRSPRRRRRAR